MGKNSSKIDQDTAKTVKRKILKNNSFCLKVVFFLTKFRENCYFSKFYVLLFLLYLGQFLSYFCPIYHFGILRMSIFLGKMTLLQYHRKWQCSNKNRQSTFFLLRLYFWKAYYELQKL